MTPQLRAQIDAMPYHEGRPIIRTSPDKKYVVCLCPFGHYYTSIFMKDWVGSWMEARASDPNWKVKCYGAMPQQEKEYVHEHDTAACHHE